MGCEQPGAYYNILQFKVIFRMKKNLLRSALFKRSGRYTTASKADQFSSECLTVNYRAYYKPYIHANQIFQKLTGVITAKSGHNIS